MRNNFYGDYHTHTRFSDAFFTTPEKNAKRAIAVGLKEIAVSDHGFANILCGLTRRKAKKQAAVIEELRQKYGIKIYRGIEADLIDSDGRIDIGVNEFGNFDFITLGFHRWALKGVKLSRAWWNIYNGFVVPVFGLKGNQAVKEKNTEAFATALRNNPIDILAHINSCAKVDYVRLCRVCAETDTLVEINMKHLADMEFMIDEILKTDCRFIVNSDAHSQKSVGNFARAEAFIKKHNIDTERIVNYGDRPIAFKRNLK